ncbi:putative uncharacterized protein [Waddlia chondrophila 2032/99]|uniref:Tetratricopeptide repeat-like domain-containing protein n=1 Tax=Waddlia chondrophila 2032/99 TaxID=765953 RepID=F8LF99_9BACT|nr:putative uncharacterized protein [Waddlia chondrophila 2032/99]
MELLIIDIIHIFRKYKESKLMNKTKTSSNQTKEPIDWVDQIQQHPAFEWMMQNLKYIPYLFIALLIMIIAGYQLISGSAAKTEANYQLAEGYWAKIQRSIGQEAIDAKQEDALLQLCKIVDKHPELRAKYDGMIAQLLIAKGLSEEASVYTERVEKRTASTQNPVFKEFSNISLLIAQGNHQEALQRSLSLKETLLKKEEPPLLLPYTLIRIAMLYQGMGEKNLEALAWDEWQQYAQEKSLQKPDTQTLKTISALFSEGDFSLDQYIAERSLEKN